VCVVRRQRVIFSSGGSAHRLQKESKECRITVRSQLLKKNKIRIVVIHW
jgi:hypothetical protein